MIESEAMASHLQELLSPAIFNQQALFRQLGMRNRILNLPLMLAAVLTLLWRNVPGVQELTRLLHKEGFLWVEATKVTQKALSKRFLTFPAILFEKVFKELLPHLQQQWNSRQKRPLPDSVSFALSHFKKIWIVDGSTLEALFRKLKSLEEVPPGTLAGKIVTVIDLATRLPVEIWLTTKASRSDVKFEQDILNLVSANTLLLLDRGFYHFHFWQQLIEQKVDFITRIKKGASFQVKEVFSNSYALRDRLIILGCGKNNTPVLTLRLVEIRSKKQWHSYLTSVLEPTILPPYVVADLYRRRWRIEQAFNTVKRLLDLSYLWTGSINGIQLQIWATWLFYAVLVDLGDSVAEELSLPFEQISLEMIYRGLYHFNVAYNKGKATDPVRYFSDPNNQDLGIVKRKRKPNIKLIVAPFPDRQRGQENFFFQNPLTSCSSA
ncbi:IS4 family transposase [Mastigocoleus sp. MO_188.B34]|uniref:IS4 family transposase n=1 Tax=Mastigocoleus sp. MO_188.B34 TaxID=3036635 RepID=UPI002628D576|nr:IS4 family transposase [Mastigocoleus sp. MO_188.B34]MDJ0697356.1 IS4 family transposase [Mastigocoleus sp. MO_188.B34]